MEDQSIARLLHTYGNIKKDILSCPTWDINVQHQWSSSTRLNRLQTIRTMINNNSLMHSFEPDLTSMLDWRSPLKLPHYIVNHVWGRTGSTSNYKDFFETEWSPNFKLHLLSRLSRSNWYLFLRCFATPIYKTFYRSSLNQYTGLQNKQ
jgi:hypothetical protein